MMVRMIGGFVAVGVAVAVWAAGPRTAEACGGASHRARR